MTQLGKQLATVWLFWLLTSFAFGDAGVLVPRGATQPNPDILSLEEMQIDIRIDNGDARVFVREIFANHTAVIQEGNYVFALPSRATISDFAVWDSLTRIPGVILERKRAEEIYNQLTAQRIDPGLLQQGERGADEARHSAAFSARIFPIPGARHQAHGDRVSREHSGRESAIAFRYSSAARRLSRLDGAEDECAFRIDLGACHQGL